MNCRKVCGLLSAYIDRELAPEEMHSVTAHLETCGSCRLEEEALSCTKKLVASLAARAPRQELETLLAQEAKRLENPTLRERVGVLVEEIGYTLRASHVPKPVAVTAVLSVAGLWLATTTLDGPRDWDANTAILNAAPTADMPQATVIVFTQAPAAPPVYSGAMGAVTVSLPVNAMQSGFTPVAWGDPHSASLMPHVNLVRAPYPRPVEWQPAIAPSPQNAWWPTPPYSGQILYRAPVRVAH